MSARPEQDTTVLAVLLDGKETVLIDLMAGWCHPCQIIAPLIDETARQQRDSLTVLKIDIDERPDIASALAIRSIPTLVLFRHGQEVARYSGVMNKLRLNAWLQQQSPAVAG